MTYTSLDCRDSRHAACDQDGGCTACACHQLTSALRENVGGSLEVPTFATDRERQLPARHAAQPRGWAGLMRDEEFRFHASVALGVVAGMLAVFLPALGFGMTP